MSILFVSSIDMNGLEILNARAQHVATLPASLGVNDSGKIFFLTTDKKLYLWNGSAYVDLSDIYTHPTTAGNKHIPAGGSEGQFLKWNADGEAIWANVPGGLQLGETETTAYRGDRGKIAYNHSQAPHAPADANNYVHPDTAGNKHIPSGGATNQVLVYGGSSGVASWAAMSNTIHGDRGGGSLHSAATTSTAGFMSADDKTKLDNATDAATAGRLMIRDANGRAKVADPSDNSDIATKGYVDGIVHANDVMVIKGTINCSTNPNYPAADAGHVYVVSVAGKIGGASGVKVEVGDRMLCMVDSSPAGNHATVGANWNIVQANIDGAVIGPASAGDGGIAVFDGTTGKLIKDSNVVIELLPSVKTTLKHAGEEPFVFQHNGSDMVGMWGGRFKFFENPCPAVGEIGLGTSTNPFKDVYSTAYYIGSTRKDQNWDAAFSHTSLTDNPHSVTKAQVGLGNVENQPVVTSEEIDYNAPYEEPQASKYMTFARTAQYVTKAFTDRTALTYTQAFTIGDGESTQYTIQHNLGNRDVMVQIYENSGDYETVYADVKRPTVNTITVTFATPPANDAYRVVVTGGYSSGSGGVG